MNNPTMVAIIVKTTRPIFQSPRSLSRKTQNERKVNGKRARIIGPWKESEERSFNDNAQNIWGIFQIELGVRPVFSPFNKLYRHASNSTPPNILARNGYTGLPVSTKFLI